MGFCDDVKAATEQITAAHEITIISHIDADGISSEAILSQAISRGGIPVRSIFVRQLEPLTMPQVPSDSSFKIFTDLGAGQQNLLKERGLAEKEVLIVDHHVSQPGDVPYSQVNCLPYGYTKMSAAGVAYLIAKEMDEANIDLAKLAVIGNVGDMMARETCGLVGPARDLIVEDGIRHRSVKVCKKDLNCYGTATRPVHLSLTYNDDPFIRGISNNPEGAKQFLKKLGIVQQTPEGRWYVWEELSDNDRRTITSALAEQLIANGESVDRLFAESYRFRTRFQEPPCGTLRSTQPSSMPAAGGQNPQSGVRFSKATGGPRTGRPNTCSATTGRSSGTCSSTSSRPGSRNWRTSSTSMSGGNSRTPSWGSVRAWRFRNSTAKNPF